MTMTCEGRQHAREVLCRRIYLTVPSDPEEWVQTQIGPMLFYAFGSPSRYITMVHWVDAGNTSF